MFKLFSPFCFLLFCFLPSAVSTAQTTLTLEDCIKIAQERSPEAQHAKNNYLDAYYQYKLYKKSYLPTLSLSGSVPAFNRSISKITLPDGTEQFVSQSAGNYSGSLSLTQPIPFMGGQFFISSGLQRLDIYRDSTTTSYLANLINIGIRQPFSLYNPYKWERKIEPLYFKEAKQLYIEALENAALQAIELYFSLLETQTNLALILQNKTNTDTLFFIAKERFAVGKTTEDEVLQLEVNLLNLTFQIEELQNTLQDKQAALADFLNIPTDAFNLLMPETLNISIINREKAYEQAVANGSQEIVHKRRLLEAQSEVARVKSENSFSVNLYASFGLSQSAPLLKEAYRSPLDQEQITLSFNIPILNWGITKYKRKKAELKLTDVSLTIEQEKQAFKRQINNAVNQYNIQSTQLQVVQKTSELSQKRYEMSKDRYLGGKIGFLDYSVAQNEKDRSQIDYIQTLQKIWTTYYEIRKITLFDFMENKQIEVGFLPK
ncbi:MAG: TolC family protein [Lentimicrobiaceae bacterium]|nr:TolC family protein [Lentimicrobiaceae bacterium]